MADWNKIAQISAVKELAEVVRRQLNVTVGLLSANGIEALLGEHQAVSRPVCDAFTSGQGACAECYRAWFEKVSLSRVPETFTCHAGLMGTVVPILVDKACVCALFASGYRMDSSVGYAAVFERSRSLGLNQATLAAALDKHQVLAARENHFLIDLLSAMAREIARALEDEFVLPRDSFSAFAGESVEAKRVRAFLELTSHSDLPVCLLGEYGTGKSLCAELIHLNSSHRGGAFLTQSCVSPIETHFESELFGHKRGAVAGAVCDMSGMLDISDGGTLVLDEIDQLTPALQRRILTLIETRSYAPIGDSLLRRTNVRIIATSRRDLAEGVEAGWFDRALYERLQALQLTLPSLREFTSDVPLLARQYAALSGKKLAFSDEVRAAVMAYDWPGNVRELQTELDRMLILHQTEGPVTIDCVSERIRHFAQKVIGTENTQAVQQKAFESLPQWLADMERSMIINVLEQNRYNRTKSAEVLGISRRNLIRKIERFGIEAPDDE